MATFGVSVPDEIKEELDKITEAWYTDRSKAIIRIFQEWKAARQPHLFLIPHEMDTVETADRFPPVDFDEPEAA